MARFVVSGRSTITPTNLLPGVSLYATAGVRAKVVEVAIFNTTATAFLAALVRLTTAGTQGAGLTEVAEDSPDHTALATGFAGHTAGPTIGGELRRADLGAAIGSGVIWTFSEKGIVIPAATAQGIGIIVPTGTGQVFDYSLTWDE